MCFKSNLIHSSFPRFYRSLFNGPTLLGIDLNSIESRLILWPCRPIRLDLQFDWMIRNGKESTWSSCSLLLAFLTMAVTSASERLSVATFLKFSAPSAKLHTKFPSSIPQWTFPLRFTALFSWFPQEMNEFSAQESVSLMWQRRKWQLIPALRFLYF